ncbi:MAG: hypothetical protein IJW36_01710 [Clostridia bacterium]|nr:hypothetical protein [Clostridia bacterium]
MLKKLFKRNLKRHQEAEQIEQPKQVKKQTLTEQLGLPFGLNEIEYISIITTFEKDLFYLAVSNREQLKVLSHTHTNSHDQIIARLEDLKSYFSSFGNYVDLGEGLPLINLHRINSVNLVFDSPDESSNKRNHAVLYLSHGQKFSTKPEISTSNTLNRNEFMFNVFWSHHNDCLYAK